MWLLGGRQGLDELYGAGPKQFDQAKTPTLPELLLALPQVGEAFEPIKHEEDSSPRNICKYTPMAPSYCAKHRRHWGLSH